MSRRPLRHVLRVYAWRQEDRFWRWSAQKLSPHMPQGVHIHGNFDVKTDSPLSISGMSVYNPPAGNNSAAFTISRGTGERED